MIEKVSGRGITYSTRPTAQETVDSQAESTNKNNDTNQNQQVLTNSDENKKEKLDKVVEGLNEFLQPSDTSLKFELHDKLNEYYVTIVDNETSEVIKEIPSKKMLDLYAAMTEFLGLVVDKKI